MVTKKREAVARRGRGIGEKHGVTKEEILKYALAQSGSFEEPALRDYLAEKLNIGRGGSKSIKKHLQDLKEGGLLKNTTTKGYANVWKIESVKEIYTISRRFPSLSREMQHCDFILDIITDAIFVFGDERFRKELRTSISFFDFFLLPSKERNERLTYFSEFKTIITPLINKKTLSGFLGKYRSNIFELCVGIDIMKSEVSKDALDRTRQIQHSRDKAKRFFERTRAFETMEKEIEERKGEIGDNAAEVLKRLIDKTKEEERKLFVSDISKQEKK